MIALLQESLRSSEKNSDERRTLKKQVTPGHNIIVDGWAAGQRHPTPIHTPTPTPHAIIQKNYPKRSFLVATHATL